MAHLSAIITQTAQRLLRARPLSRTPILSEARAQSYTAHVPGPHCATIFSRTFRAPASLCPETRPLFAGTTTHTPFPLKLP